ncbi:MAG: serine/threonine-protein kinase [Gammaproteobacteria bacterium]|nr:serine/threonine-protein kinase [Gammaproteobacteria bacterium]
MKFFEDCPTLNDIGFDLSMQKFKSSGSVALDDDKAVKLIYNTFNVVDKLHTARIILGDINPSNLLYNPKSNDPIIIDIDSVQIGQFKCLVCSPEYIDPLIQQQGKNITYSEENDIFSIACICFQLIIGKNPFWVLTDPLPPPVT